MIRLLKKVSSVLLIIAVIGLSVTLAAQAAGKPEKVTVIYGGATWLGHYPAWVGIEKGIFKKHGLGVLWQQFYGSSSRMGSMTAGDVDLASTGCIGAIALMASGVKSFYAVGTQDSYATVEGIIARKGINSIQDLKGKKVAATFASSAHVLVLDVLEQNGIDPKKDLTLLNLKVTEMPAAMKSGEIDACAAWTPHFNRIMNMPGNKLLVDDTKFSLFKQYDLGPGPDLLVVRREFADKYPNSVAAFWEGFFESMEFIKNKPEESAKVLMKLTNLNMKDQLSVMKDVKWIGKDQQKALMVNPGNYVQGLQKLADFLVRHGQLDEAPTVKEWVNPDLIP